jgi:hypothetical protein
VAKKKIATADDWAQWAEARRRLEARMALTDERRRERAARRARRRRLTFGLLGR